MRRLREGMVIALGTTAVFAVPPMPLNAEDFDAGKSAPELFASNCSSCHHTPHGLAKRMNGWSLDSFLQEHYTASRASADTLSAYLFGVGGTAHHSRHKRAKSVATTTSHATESISRPPADISNRKLP